MHHVAMTNWTRPPVGTIRINCDASWSNETRTGGFGIIRRDHLGQVVGVVNRTTHL